MDEQSKIPTLYEILTASRYNKDLKYARALHESTFGRVSPVLHIEPRQKFSELMFPDKGAEIARELAHRTEPYVIIDAEFGKAHLINPNPQEN